MPDVISHILYCLLTTTYSLTLAHTQTQTQTSADIGRLHVYIISSRTSNVNVDSFLSSFFFIFCLQRPMCGYGRRCVQTKLSSLGCNKNGRNSKAISAMPIATSTTINVTECVLCNAPTVPTSVRINETKWMKSDTLTSCHTEMRYMHLCEIRGKKMDALKKYQDERVKKNEYTE